MNKALLWIAFFFLDTGAARACPTDVLRGLVGEFSGVASIVTAENDKFALRKPSFWANTSIANRSVFALGEKDSCSTFHITIDYLNPDWSTKLKLKRDPVAREVQFVGTSDDKGSFTLATGGEARGRLRQIDESTFLAEFTAPNPLDSEQQTFCREFITLVSGGKRIVRTIQVFNADRTELVQYRLVKEERVSEREPSGVSKEKKKK